MRRLATAVLISLAAAGCGTKGATPPHGDGAESFESQAPGSRGTGTTTANGGAGAAAPTGAPAASGTTDASTTRTVEEADVYKRVGSTLYVLNAYRGLQVVDVAVPAAPRLLARVPVVGTPVDLYVEGTTAFVVVTDWFSYGIAADGEATPQRGSRVLAVDVSVPAAPRVLADLPVDGQVEQTRIVGDVLYVVSHNTWWYRWVEGGPGGAVASAPVASSGGGTASAGSGTAIAGSMAPTYDETVFVASFDLKDPASPRAVARLELPAGGWSSHAHVTAERVTLAFSAWTSQGGTYGPTTSFQVIDISDPGGALVAGTTFTTAGSVQDRWSMDYDAGTGLFRAVVAAGWNAGAALQIWSSPAPDQATPVSRLPVQVAESLTAARFDGSRVYLVTALQKDPLWAVDASDPAHPTIAGALHMEGQLDYVEPRGDRLVALGHTSEAGQPFQLSVSLLDVSKLSSPALLSRVVFGSSYAWVAASRDDLRKAFIVLDPPPAGIGLVLVPLQGWDSTSYAYLGGTQLVDLGRDTLTLQGFLAHPGGVIRSFPLDDAGHTLAALSDAALQTIDATSRAAPAELGRIDLARSVSTLALAHGKAVELAGDWYRGAAELVVTDALDPDAPTPLARVALGAPSARLYQDGDVLWVVARDWQTGKAWLQAVDVRDPLHPATRGRLDLDAQDAVVGGASVWGYGDEAVLVGHALAVHRWSYGCSGGPCPVAGVPAGGSTATAAPTGPTQELRVFDLTDPDHPRLASTVALPDGWAWGLQAYGSYLWLTHFEWSASADTGRYYVDRVDLTRPAAPVLLPKVNVPGVLFSASADGARLRTLETWYQGDAVTTYLHALELTPSGTARLVGSARLDGYPSGAAASDRHAWVVTGASSSQASSQLSAIDLETMSVTSQQAVGASWVWLRTAAASKLFLQTSWYDQGILVYGIGDGAHPAFDRFVRTPGWVWDVVVGNGYAYLPSGPYGVPMIPLAP